MPRFFACLLAACVFLTLALAPFEAEAKKRRGKRTYARAYSAVIVAPQRCQRLCDWDYSPCDPMYFKHADGRCNSYFGGGGLVH